MSSYHPLIFSISHPQFYRCLKRLDYQQTGYLSYEDFDEAIGHILPVATTKLKRTRYNIAAADFPNGNNLVPIGRLAHVASYIGLQNCYENNWSPQTLISVDSLDLARSERSTAPSDQNRTGGADGDDDDFTQQELENILAMGANPIRNLDEKLVDEEAKRLSRRVNLMRKKDTPPRGTDSKKSVSSQLSDSSDDEEEEAE